MLGSNTNSSSSPPEGGMPAGDMPGPGEGAGAASGLLTGGGTRGGASSGLSAGGSTGGGACESGSGGSASTPGRGGEVYGSGLPSGGGRALLGWGLGAGAASGLPSDSSGGMLWGSGLGGTPGSGLPSDGSGGRVSGCGLGGSASSAAAGWGAAAGVGAGAAAGVGAGVGAADPVPAVPLPANDAGRQMVQAQVHVFPWKPGFNGDKMHAMWCSVSLRSVLSHSRPAWKGGAMHRRRAHLLVACRPPLLRRRRPPCSKPGPCWTYTGGSRCGACRWRSENCWQEGRRPSQLAQAPDTKRHVPLSWCGRAVASAAHPAGLQPAHVTSR